MSSGNLQATIAVDTDAEFCALFADTQAAANYVALMVAYLDTAYSREIGVSIKLGEALGPRGGAECTALRANRRCGSSARHVRTRMPPAALLSHPCVHGCTFAQCFKQASFDWTNSMAIAF